MSSSLVPVTLLTGFLGSGKTTVLNRLLKRPEMGATAVIVNEFGEIGLDHVLIERASADTVLLASGCICCTVRDDLGATLAQLMLQRARGEVPAFTRVVVETTGLADPAPILHLVMTDPAVAARYRLGGVVTTVDAVNGSATLDRHAEAVKQAALAERLLVTKTDLAPAPVAARLRARLNALNPGARSIDVVNGVVDPAGLFDTALYDEVRRRFDVGNWLRAGAWRAHAACREDPAAGGEGSGHAHDHDHGIRSFCVVREAPVSWDAFSQWLEVLSSMRGEDLLRVKGIVNIAERPGEPVVIHGVQRLFHPPVLLDAWPDGDRRTRLVFITRNIAQSEIEGTLRLLDAR